MPVEWFAAQGLIYRGERRDRGEFLDKDSLSRRIETRLDYFCQGKFGVLNVIDPMQFFVEFLNYGRVQH